MNRSEGPFGLRLVIPVHDEGPRLAALLEDLVGQAPGAGVPQTHLVVVDDGSRPAAVEAHAAAVAQADRRLVASGTPHRASFQALPVNQGKAAAIRHGWSSDGEAGWLGFVDGDGAVPAAEVWRLAARLTATPPFDALVSARVPGAGRRLRRTPLRDLQGRVFSRLVEAVLGFGLRDPQCGLKLFRAERLRPLLPGLQERRWLLDLELLVLLARQEARVVEEPIDWHESGRSKVVAGVDPLRMLLGLLRLRARLGRGRRRVAP